MSAARILRVVGVSFIDAYPANLLRLRDIAQQASDGEDLAVILRRNPNNPHDANAVEVHVPCLGDDAMVGHVARDQAARLAPLLDQGARFATSVFAVAVDPAHTDRPGLELRIRPLEGAEMVNLSTAGAR